MMCDAIEGKWVEADPLTLFFSPKQNKKEPENWLSITCVRYISLTHYVRVVRSKEKEEKDEEEEEQTSEKEISPHNHDDDDDDDGEKEKRN